MRLLHRDRHRCPHDWVAIGEELRDGICVLARKVELHERADSGLAHTLTPAPAPGSLTGEYEVMVTEMRYCFAVARATGRLSIGDCRSLHGGRRLMAATMLSLPFLVLNPMFDAREYLDKEAKLLKKRSGASDELSKMGLQLKLAAAQAQSALVALTSQSGLTAIAQVPGVLLREPGRPCPERALPGAVRPGDE